MYRKSFSSAEKWILAAIPLLFVIGAILHFAYPVLGKSPWVGLFAPVNESVWEHTKLILFPCILFWSLFYVFRGKSYGINQAKWFQGALFSLIASIVVMLTLYYLYTGALGVELLWVDILLLLISIMAGQLLGLHVYRYGEGVSFAVVVVTFFLIFLLFVLLTFFPPHIPLFQDGQTGGYGILHP